MLKLTLPGASLLYYGEEIGLTNIDTEQQCLDPAGSAGNGTGDSGVRAKFVLWRGRVEEDKCDTFCVVYRFFMFCCL